MCFSEAVVKNNYNDKFQTITELKTQKHINRFTVLAQAIMVAVEII